MSALPELPEHDVVWVDRNNADGTATYSGAHSDFQMREYGDARAAHARKAALDEAEKVVSRIKEPDDEDSFEAGVMYSMEAIRNIK